MRLELHKTLHACVRMRACVREIENVPPVSADTPQSWLWCRAQQRPLSLRSPCGAGCGRAARLHASVPLPDTQTSHHRRPASSNTQHSCYFNPPVKMSYFVFFPLILNNFLQHKTFSLNHTRTVYFFMYIIFT